MIPSWMAACGETGPLALGGKRLPTSFAERTLLAVSRLVGRERASCGDPRGLAAFDPRAKLLSAIALLVGLSLTRSLPALGACALLVLALAVVSRLSLGAFIRDAWVVPLLFTGAVAAPALFSAFTPGPAIAHTFGLTVTREGALAASRLVLRVVASVSVALLLMRTTGATPLIGALRSLGVSKGIALVASMTYRYLFLLAREVQEMHVGLLSRRLTPLPTAAGRAYVASRMAVLLAKANRTAAEVHLAMVSRGFRGEWRTRAAPRLGPRDAGLLAAAAAVSVLVALAPGVR